MVPDFIVIGTARTIAAQLAEIKRRSLGVVPAIREAGPFDGRAPRPQDRDGFVVEAKP